MLLLKLLLLHNNKILALLPGHGHTAAGQDAVMPIKKDDPNSEKEDLKKTRFFRNRRPKEDLY